LFFFLRAGHQLLVVFYGTAVQAALNDSGPDSRYRYKIYIAENIFTDWKKNNKPLITIINSRTYTTVYTVRALAILTKSFSAGTGAGFSS